MRISLLLASIALPMALLLPAPGSAHGATIVAQSATTTQSEAKDAVKTALKSVDLTFKQKREIKPMIKNYEAQTANADEATKKADQKALLENIYAVLTPAQQTQFKASLKTSMQNSQ